MTPEEATNYIKEFIHVEVGRNVPGAGDYMAVCEIIDQLVDEIERLGEICRNVIDATQTDSRLDSQDSTRESCLEVINKIYDLASDYYPPSSPILRQADDARAALLREHR